jgi:1D-myo-inositol-tetrakisphosphate 5-kinase/inositol-polyphosphate multikinase
MSPPTPFAHQVGGHPSTILSSPLSHSTLIKPSSLTEHAFYTSLGPSLHPDFVGVWTPEYYGMLKLQGKMGEGGVEKVEGSGEEVSLD